MYQYVESGLPNQYLVNGYKTVDTPYGQAVVIEGVKELHKSIASWLVATKPALEPREFRFIRKYLDLTQEAVAYLAGVDAQTVRRWEHETVPQWGDRLIRYAFRDYTTGKKSIVGLIDTLQELEQKQFEDAQVQWHRKKPRGKAPRWEAQPEAA